MMLARSLLVALALLLAGGSVLPTAADEAPPPTWVREEMARSSGMPFVWIRFWTSDCDRR